MQNNTVLMRAAVHASLIYVVLVGLGIFVIPGWLPPPSPSFGADVIGPMIAEGSASIRAGMVVALFASPFSLCLPSVISAMMRRIEGQDAVLAPIQFACAIIACVIVGFSSVYWIAISWRSGIDSSIAHVVNDICWFFIISYGPPVIMQTLTIAVCIHMNRKNALFPAWLAYFNYWMSVLTIPAMATFFFKTGPLAWNGVIGFWIPVGCYFLWWVVMYIATLRAINRLEAAQRE